MKIHHLNCGTMCPAGGGLIDGRPGFLRPARMVCHCLLIETDAGLVAIDTGIGLADMRRDGRLGLLFDTAVRPRYLVEESLAAQVQALGYALADVRHIVPTHLDLDHAGGLPDFPEAVVHVHARELASARQTRGPRAHRYRRHQLQTLNWREYAESEGDRWYGFEAIRPLGDLGQDIVLIPLGGHSAGQCGVAVRDGDRWLFHCGDAYFHHGQLQARAHCPPGLQAFQRLIQWDGELRRRNLERLRQLHLEHGRSVVLFCAHDGVELDRLQAVG